ncbi:MAG: hypothetical protein NTY02_07115, partial [Acidobacteria bacterium]|nr:hypothetical protein [Acidobacteriota bacterium]
MLMVLSVLSAVTSPVIGDYVNDARQVKAASDVQLLASTFAQFAGDTAVPGATAMDWHHLQVLASAGAAPGAPKRQAWPSPSWRRT